jgi:hypothetical protein
MLVETLAIVAIGFVRAPALEPPASWAAGKPVAVYCGPLREVSGTVDTIGGQEIRLSTRACGFLRQRLAGRLRLTDIYDWQERGDELVWHMLALAHEAAHLRGIQNECETDRAALRGMASRFFGFKTWTSRHILMDFAWAAHERKPPVYQEC